jgi:hypothetical protein
MPKRTFWFVSGAAAGLGSSLWVQHRVKEAVERYVPEKVQARAADAARRVGPALRDAVTEGRDAMRQREAQMRADVDERMTRRPPEARRRAG